MSDRPIEMKVQQRAIEPFWSKLPFLFRFPFRPAPLIFLLCLVAASALAGLVLGPFGLVFRGILIYLGLRYGFNVLDLFRKGRFEGESPDHSLWGADTRPAKLGGVIALFVLIGALLGSWAVDARVQSHAPTQQLLLDAYAREHASELAAIKQGHDEERARLQEAARAAAVPSAEEEAADADVRAEMARWRQEQRAEVAEALAELDKTEAAQGPYGRPRHEILREARVDAGSALWFRILPWWFWAAMVVLSFMLPASTLVIAIDDEFFRALNPTWVAYFLRAMGSAYFVLWAFFLAVVFSRQIVLGVGGQWPTFVRLPIEMGLGGYLGVVLCALLGYVIYQFHQELHLDVEVDFDTHRHAGGAEAIAQAGSARKAIDAADPQSPLGRRVQELVAKGGVREAIDLVKDELRYDRLDPELNQQLHALYLRGGDRAVTLSHGQTLLRALVRAGDHKSALAALRKLMTMDERFIVEDAAARAALAQAAQAQGDAELAARVARSPGR